MADRLPPEFAGFFSLQQESGNGNIGNPNPFFDMEVPLDLMDVEGESGPPCEHCHLEMESRRSTEDGGIDEENVQIPDGGEAEGLPLPCTANVNAPITEGGGVHPLLFPDVVRDIMNHLSARDVEKCRLVCRVWNNEACKVLRNKRVVVFLESESVRAYNLSMGATTDFPHAKYEFCVQDFTGLVDEHLREFWRIFGPHIRALEFRQQHIFWRDFFDVIDQRVPNLETLALKHLPRNVLRGRPLITDRNHILPVKILRLASLPATTAAATERLADLLKSLPNLEELEFLPVKNAVLQTRVCNVVIDVLGRPEVSLPNLRKVNLSLDLSTEGLEALTAKRFPFQTLNVTLKNGIKATTLKDLLLSLRPTLTELKISFPDSYANHQTFLTMNNSMKPEESVQVLTNLQSLSMRNFKGSINFVQNMSALKQLQFSTANLAQSVPLGFKQRSPALGSRRSVEHSLRGLRITTTKPVAETLVLEGIARCFPHLNHLHLHDVDDDGLGIIYRNLPFLSHVDLLGAKCTDQGLTGIPLEICNDMVETSTFIVVQAERYRRDLFIGSLQFLRKFSITGSKISDASIALGLADCKNLRQLKIGSPMVTDTGVIFITDKFFKQLDYLDVSECTELTEQSKYYAGEKMQGILKVAELPEAQTSMKPPSKPPKECTDRGFVKAKRSDVPSFPFVVNPTHSKFISPEYEFFEEHSDDELRIGVGVFPPAPFPADRNRQRVLRVREALRRNADFMRVLQRMDINQFRRLFRQGHGRRFLHPIEFQRQMANQPARNIVDAELGRAGDPDRFFRHVEVAAPIPLEQELLNNNNNNNGPDLNVIDGPPERIQDEREPPQPQHEVEQNRLPEFHIAEIIRLGLRFDDVEFWLRNHPIFEGLDNENAEAVFARAHHEALLHHFHLEEEGEGAIAAENPLPDEEDIDLDALRRVVLNVIGEEMHLEDDEEHHFVAQPPDIN